MDPVMLRRIEYLSGVGAAVLGVVLSAYAIIFTPYMAPLMPGTDIGALMLFVLIAVPSVLVGVAAWFDSHYSSADRGIGIGMEMLWVGMIMLWGVAFFIQLGFNLYVLPAAILALVSALSASWAMLQMPRGER